MSVDHEIQLSSILEVIWRRGRMMMLVSLICMALAAAFSYTIQNRYRAEVDLIMMKSKIGERSMMFPGFSMDTYTELIVPDAVLQQVIDKFNLDEAPFHLGKINALAGRIHIENEQGSARIQLSVELEDPEMAAKVANEIANLAITLNKDVISTEQNNSRDLIKQQISPIYDQAQQYLKTYREMIIENKLPLLQQKLDTNNTILATLRQQRDTLIHSLRELEIRNKRFDDIFSATDAPKELLKLRRSIFEDSAMLEQLKKESPNLTPDEKFNFGYTEESGNVVYQILMTEYLKLKVDLPALKGKLESIESEIQRLESVVNEQQERFFRLNVEETEAKRYWDQSLEVLAGIEKNMDWAGTTVASERQDLKIAYPAIADHQKVYPRRSLIVLVSGLIALMLMFVYYLMKDLYGLVATERPSVSG
ncbi:hypothetical protein K8I31_22250 [bacterium]|nr:hypothetical protein [bacterium]